MKTTNSECGAEFGTKKGKMAQEQKKAGNLLE
jgi:hypothetical protein